MRAHPLYAVLAAWLVASPIDLTHARPNALAEPQPVLAGPSVHLLRRQDHHHERSDHDDDDDDAEVDEAMSEPEPAHATAGGGHDHMHFDGSPMTELNETFILLYHKPTPPSYGTHDFEDPNVSSAYPSLMGLHVILMSAAFFVALPIGIALRSVNHPLHSVSVVAFYALCALGIATSMLYRKLTPNMYEGAVHAKQGYFVLFVSAVLTTCDTFSTLRRIYRYAFAVRAGERDFSVKSFWEAIRGSRSTVDDYDGAYTHEYSGLVVEEPEEMDIGPHELKLENIQSEVRSEETRRWASDMRELHRHHRRQRSSEWRSSVASDGTLIQSGALSPRGSQHSEDTLHDPTPRKSLHPKDSRWKRVGRIAFATTERVLVLLGYMQVLTGSVIYTGICRDSYVNGCLAHLIKGGLFWCYGLFTFARFLGSFAELGWSWNLAPRPDGNNGVVSLEFVENLLIFLYGVTNTWMERFGVPPGSPYTTKEVQHISIAVMFWFAGLVGMGIESRRVRRWLSAPVSAAYAAQQSLLSTSPTTPTPPASYRASFNPFPALVIGVTGAAMSAHAQVYVFQVQIHALWGGLLLASSVFRWLTYFFVWLGPPKSVLPGRPPTEALASFFLACGGLMFQLSTEEITIAAMRRGHADQMMFLNVAVAFTCLMFCWTLCLVAFKGWLKERSMSSLTVGKHGAVGMLAA